MSIRNNFFFIVGFFFMILAKVKNILQGYSSPKPFNISEIGKCIDYDISVVDHWLTYLKEYTKNDFFISGKNILELGPGSDLGAGIYLLLLNASKYNAIDVNNLEKKTPEIFYQHLFEHLLSFGDQFKIESLKEQLRKTKAGAASQINYVIQENFDIVTELGEDTIDVVFSQAAFEHFDNVEEVIEQLSTVCRPGAVLTAEIDLKTHSRWIRDNDPNNIYRYSEKLYRIFQYKGAPNRIRPYQYKNIFEHYGWIDVTITPLVRINNYYPEHISGMDKQFKDDINQMDYLTIMLCAKKV